MLIISFTTTLYKVFLLIKLITTCNMQNDKINKHVTLYLREIEYIISKQILNI